MRDVGILPGDLLAVKRTPIAENGQIVVARLGEDVTVKRFERHGSIVRLLPANPDFAPIRIDLERQELVIEGRAVGLIRDGGFRSEEHTSELQSLMRISYAVFCLTK